jgi:hypothetical protein
VWGGHCEAEHEKGHSRDEAAGRERRANGERPHTNHTKPQERATHDHTAAEGEGPQDSRTGRKAKKPLATVKATTQPHREKQPRSHTTYDTLHIEHLLGLVLSRPLLLHELLVSCLAPPALLLGHLLSRGVHAEAGRQGGGDSEALELRGLRERRARARLQHQHNKQKRGQCARGPSRSGLT